MGSTPPDFEKCRSSAAGQRSHCRIIVRPSCCPPLTKGRDMDCGWIGWCVMKPEVQAAWVQAVGSVLAIIAAIVIAWWQQRASQRELAERDHREKIGRHVRANRIFGRFDRLISNQMEGAEAFRSAYRTGNIQVLSVPDDLRDLESEMHLLDNHAGGPGFTSINQFEEAQDLIRNGSLAITDNEKFIETLVFAQKECRDAMSKVQAFLATLH